MLLAASWRAPLSCMLGPSNPQADYTTATRDFSYGLMCRDAVVSVGDGESQPGRHLSLALGPRWR